MRKTRLDRQVNGTLMHKKEFQAAIIKAVRDGNVWPAEIAHVLGWNGTLKERAAITNDMHQLVRLGHLQSPAGYSVTEEGERFIQMYSKPKDVSAVPTPVPPTKPYPPVIAAMSTPIPQGNKAINPAKPTRTVASPVGPAASAPQRPISPTPIRPTAPEPISLVYKRGRSHDQFAPSDCPRIGVDYLMNSSPDDE